MEKIKKHKYEITLFIVDAIGMILELAAREKYNGSDEYKNDPAVVAVYQQARFQSADYTIIPPLEDEFDAPGPGYGIALYDYAVSNANVPFKLIFNFIHPNFHWIINSGLINRT